MLPESESLTQKFLKRGGYLYLFSYLIAPAGYLINVVLANDLTVSEFGILSTLLSLVMMFSIYADAGLYEGLQHFLPQYLTRGEISKAKALFLGVFSCRLIGGTLLTIVMYCLAPWIATTYSFPDAVNIVRIYALFFFCIAFFDITVGLLMAIQDTLTYKLLDMARFYTTLALTVLVWYMGLGNIESYALVWLAGVALVALLSVVVIVVKFRISFTGVKADWHLPWWKILGYSLIILASNNISAILHQSDIQLLAYFTGPEEAGYYGVYLKLIGIPFILLGPIVSLITPVVSEMYGRWESEKIVLIRSFFRQYLVIGSLIFSGWLFAVAPQLASSLMSEKFAFSGEILRYSLPFIPLLFALQIDFAILSGLGRARERIRAILIGTIANLLLVLTAIHIFPTFGLSPSGGVALAVGISWCVLVYATNHLLRDHASHLDLKKLAIAILATIFLTASLVLFMPLLGWVLWSRTEQILALAGLWFLYILPFAALFWWDIRTLKSQLIQLKNSDHVHTT